MTACSIVIPVHNRAALTQRCLDAILADPPSAPHEVIVVDDASSDSTPALLSGYAERGVRVVTRATNGGFAETCNEGAQAAGGGYLLFLNNDTLPQPGWLDALASHAERHPEAAIVGSKLLFPNDTIQHAGVVLCLDGYPRHLYAGFPADHPATCRSRPFQAVTAACALFRREAFEAAGGFDPAFKNSFEDVDLCLRIGELGHEVHYCHESLLYHLESVSRGRRSKDIDRSARLFRSRWTGRARADDFDYYLADGLLRWRYGDSYPMRVEVAPELALVAAGADVAEGGRLLDARTRQVLDLLRETVRLTAHIAELELAGATSAATGASAPAASPAAGTGGPLTQEQLSREVERIELEIQELQTRLAESLPPNGARGDGDGFTPSDYLSYRKLAREVQEAVRRHVPEGATVLVVSRGDDELLEVGDRRGWHFPRDEDGSYAGWYPRDSEAAIDQLEDLRSRGARYLVLPSTSAWWLEHYPDFARHLEERHEPLAVEDVCRIYALRPGEEGR